MRENAQEITITYETLFDIVRREKNQEPLQPLSARFYDDLLEYLRQKKRSAELSGAGPFDEASIQLANIKKLVRELHDRREKKIIAMAMDSARSGSTTVSDALLAEEKKMYMEASTLLTRYRVGILQRLLQFQQPQIASPIPAAVHKESPAERNTMLRFISSVPKFVGTNLEIYGPFKDQDVANLPVEIAKVLVEKGKAEILEMQ